ncbi:MAG: transcription termination factor Rho [Eubacterium sp.]|nr:transcription termination factor Rho [Eubacterium sp.]
MREKYESLPLKELREVAKARGLKKISTLKKAELVDRMVEEDEKEAKAKREAASKSQSRKRTDSRQGGGRKNGDRSQGKGDHKKGDQHKKSAKAQAQPVAEEAESAEEAAPAADMQGTFRAYGILEVLTDGFGFIRSDNFLPGDADVYVSPSQIRRFNLRTGDMITGITREKAAGEKFAPLLHVSYINNETPDHAQTRGRFEDMTPIFPNERIHLEREGADVSMRIVDLISPIGKGQRGMIVSPPKAGKTTLLKQVAKSIQINNPEMHMIILLVDERPEEVTDMKEAIKGPNVEIIYSTFDELPEHHKRVSEMVVDRARRLVEHKKDVIILLDSITRLSRAYNLTVPPSGRTLSGGLDPTALYMPKKFFGAARNMREGGSLTVLATALVDTGSKMDDVVYEEFKGTGNMELVLDRKISEKRVFPAIDIAKSGTRREDLLLTKDEQEAVTVMRRSLNGMKSDEAADQILTLFARTRANRELVALIQKRRGVY